MCENTRPCAFKKVWHLLSKALGWSSFMEYGHFISINPSPQQWHLINPSGVAPKYGYIGFTTSPAVAYWKPLCDYDASEMYSCLASSSWSIPQLMAGTWLKLVFSISLVATFSGFFAVSMLWKDDAVSLPFHCLYHISQSLCDRVACLMTLHCSWVILKE